MNCTAPTCAGTAILQWQRLATDTETSIGQVATVESVAYGDAIKRARQRGIIASLEEIRPHIEPGQLPNLEKQIAAETRKLDLIRDTPPAPLPDDVVLVAVFGCEAHAVDDDSAGRIHEPTCLSDGHCGCHTDPYPGAV